MPDISMCHDKTCTKRKDCYRYRAQANEFRQSYFMGSPKNEDGSCDHHCPVQAGDRLTPLEELDARSWT